jgi:hypothetical protein
MNRIYTSWPVHLKIIKRFTWLLHPPAEIVSLRRLINLAILIHIASLYTCEAKVIHSCYCLPCKHSVPVWQLSPYPAQRGLDLHI